MRGFQGAVKFLSHHFTEPQSRWQCQRFTCIVVLQYLQPRANRTVLRYEDGEEARSRYWLYLGSKNPATESYPPDIRRPGHAYV